MSDQIHAPSLSYKDAGVDIDAGNSLVERIKSASKKTHRSGVMGALGGFGALFDLKATGFSDPVLVAATDGVGTKLRLAIEAKRFETIGQDLVAMCVNDLLCQGAIPLFFLDYYATGKLSVEEAAETIQGIARACEACGCALIGGETAEMPGMYQDGDFDLAGFAVGAVERTHILPQMSRIAPGDILIGLGSSGPHSNGYSLIRKIIENDDLSVRPPFSSAHTLSDVLLEPTRLYVKPVLPVLKNIKAMAHITGGGLAENIARVLPNVRAEIDVTTWPTPPIFQWLAQRGNVAQAEMLKTFNCGIGMVLVVEQGDVAHVCAEIDQTGVPAHVIGHISTHASGETPDIVISGEIFS